MNKIALVSALALLALAAEPAAAAPVAAYGTIAYAYQSCPADTVPMAAADNGDGTWTFVIVDIGAHACSAWVEPGALTGTGSPAAGFTGDVSSLPWTVVGSAFTATLTFTLALSTAPITAVATGELA